ncbi:MAG: N-acetylmuramoyl-L-alanine amidase [Desulfobacterota bacterium]|nr:N-acetylmuramoyl-L-alanine amidase [Thermodesulfobacteriota bacterium]
MNASQQLAFFIATTHASLRHHLFLQPVAYIALLVVLVCSGCIKPLLPQRVSVQVPPECIDAVKGKTIVIDPGHGGSERGAIGKNGLHEAEVNLGVALYLWGLLKQAGAQPVLTRSTDTCVLQEGDFDLTRELRARADIGNRSAADLFISIHHNADEHNSRRNDLIVFYKMSDPGQSRDVAREIKTALAHVLKPQKASIQPGNFHVLRASNGPAVLGEASFITTDKTATLLAYHRTLAAEATGYFQGICAYFQKGVPRIVDCSPDKETLATPRPAITCRTLPGVDTATIDPPSLAVMLDEKALDTCSVQADTIRCIPSQPLANALHRYCMTIRNSNGNISAPYCASFLVALPAQKLTITSLLSPIPQDTQTAIPLTVWAYDAFQRPVADGTAVDVTITGGKIESPRVLTVNGTAQVLLYPDPQKDSAVVNARCGDAVTQVHVAFGKPEAALFLARIANADGNPLSNAALMRDGKVVAVSDMFGYVHDSVETAGTVDYNIQKKGYETAQIRVALARGSLVSQTVSLMPRDGGVFFTRTVMLDCADEQKGIMQLAATLSARIEEAGGTVVYAWQTPPAPSDAQRVLAASKAGAHIYIRFVASKKPATLYYYKSIHGEAVASSITRCMSDTPIGKQQWDVRAGTDYILAHTAMPAVIVALPVIAGEHNAAAAACVYSALREFFAQQHNVSVQSQERISPQIEEIF